MKDCCGIRPKTGLAARLLDNMEMGNRNHGNADIHPEIVAAIRNVQFSRNERLETELLECRNRLGETRDKGRKMALEIDGLRARLSNAEGRPAVMSPMVTFHDDGSLDGAYATIQPKN